MNEAPTVAHFVWLPAPQGGRVSPWGGPAAKPLFIGVSV
jgi:hypothetical protein